MNSPSSHLDVGNAPAPAPRAWPGRGSDYTVRAADLDADRQTILALWADNLPSSAATPQQRLAWYYQQNPLGRGRIWILTEKPAGNPVGVAGLGLRCLCAGGRSLLVGLASDLAVDPRHRTLRPAMLLARAVMESAPDNLSIIYGVPARHSAGLFQRLGYHAVGHLARYVKPLRIDRFLHPLASVHRTVPRALSALLNPAMRLVSAETWRRDHGFQIVPITAFDQRFDELFARVAGHYPVIGRRCADFLNWRFANCPFARYHTLAILDRGGDRALGYAVCLVDDREQLSVVDLLVEPVEGAAGDLLAAVISYARVASAASVCVSGLGLQNLQRPLASLGFRARPGGHALMCYPAATAIGDGDLAHGWYFTGCDEDYD